MSLSEIEQAVEKLPPRELEAFRRWFAAFDAQRWDEQIEADVASGKLDALAGRALTVYRRGDAQEM